MKNFTFLKGPRKKMLLHQRANHADQEKINMRVTTSQYEIYLISGQNSHLLSQNVFLQSIIYSTEKTIHWNKQHFCMR